MDAWQKGDVSSALDQAGRRARAGPARARLLQSARAAPTYQSFYNEVRSEHDAMNTAYAEARKHLADRNFGKAHGRLSRLIWSSIRTMPFSRR